MRKILIAIIILLSINSQGQNKKINHFTFNGEKIEYSRLDYSQYGIAHLFVSMYEENDKNKLIELEACGFLKSQDNLYHTLFFFIKVPSKFSFEDKQKIFSGIMTEIEEKENLEKFNLYLNFDINYSGQYQTGIVSNNLIKVKRVLLNINEINIKKGLFAMRE